MVHQYKIHFILWLESPEDCTSNFCGRSTQNAGTIIKGWVFDILGNLSVELYLLFFTIHTPDLVSSFLTSWLVISLLALRFTEG